jgi:hypothetical protein
MAQRMNKLQKEANESRTAYRQRYSRLPLIITKELRGETNRLRGLRGLPANAKTPRIKGVLQKQTRSPFLPIVILKYVYAPANDTKYISLCSD